MNLSLLTDLYELTMAEGYWRLGMAEKEAVFHLLYRTPPFSTDFAIACGLESVIEWCSQLAFGKEEIYYLASLPSPTGKPLFSSDFLSYLGSVRFTCDLDAIEEGRRVYPHQPLIRVQGPLLQAQLLETYLLNQINFQTLIATKAAAVRLAAGSDQVLEFGARRAQGVDGALSASRAAYIGGCDAVSNVLAGYKFGIPVAGTHAHSWVMAFESEEEAFEGYRTAMSHNCTFLVDTYKTSEGLDRAIKVAKRMIESDEKPLGIRLDSGDLLELSIEARAKLDAAGLESMAVVASNELDEVTIKQLKESGSPISVWGVGTRLATGHPKGALDGVYKLSALHEEDGWLYKEKRSDSRSKSSPGGIFQVRRFADCDIVYDLSNPPEREGEDLLVPIFRRGDLLYRSPSIGAVRDLALREMQG